MNPSILCKMLFHFLPESNKVKKQRHKRFLLQSVGFRDAALRPVSPELSLMPSADCVRSERAGSQASFWLFIPSLTHSLAHSLSQASKDPTSKYVWSTFCARLFSVPRGCTDGPKWIQTLSSRRKALTSQCRGSINKPTV